MVSIDIMGVLIRSERGNRYVFVITDRFIKLVQSAHLIRITSAEIAKACVTNFVFLYYPRRWLLYDNGKQFFFRKRQGIFHISGLENIFTMTYYQSANGHVESFNCTLYMSFECCI